LRSRTVQLVTIIAAALGTYTPAAGEALRYSGKPTSIHLAKAALESRHISARPNVFLQPPRMRLVPQIEAREIPASTKLQAPPAQEPSPAPLRSFRGQEGRFSVPDTMGSVGTQHVMSTLNDSYRVQTRSGTALWTIDDEVFWSNKVASLQHFDPRVLYDGYAGRWTIVAAYLDQTRSIAGIKVAVSRTHDPTGDWVRYTFPAATGDWVDFPMAAFNEAAITIAMNSIASNDVGRTVIYVIDKAGLYSENGGFSYDHITSSGDVMTPVTVYGEVVRTSYLVERASDLRGVRLYRASGNNVILVAAIPAPLDWSEDTPLLPQLGSSVRISAGDTRVTNAVMRNGAIWFSQTVFLPAGLPMRSAVQWWKVSTTGGLLDFGRIEDPSGIVSYCFPSIAVNANNDVAIGFSRFEANSFPAAAYAVRANGDPAGTFRTPVILKTGQGPYDERSWGDYSATVPDPDDSTFWTLQEYAAFPSNGPTWGVWWGHVPAPPPPVVPKRRSARH
jgi:hypothetical protein